MQTTLRWCKDIKMWAIDRPINDVGDVNGSCVHRTSFCDTSCYNVKLYKMFKGMAKKDIANEKFWQSLPTNKNDNQIYDLVQFRHKIEWGGTAIRNYVEKQKGLSEYIAGR